jgi:hypothetical protein
MKSNPQYQSSLQDLGHTTQGKSEIKTIIKGGLGNQILQYLAGKHLAESTQVQGHALDLSWFSQTTNCQHQKQRKPDILELLQNSEGANIHFNFERSRKRGWPILKTWRQKQIYIEEKNFTVSQGEESPLEQVKREMEIAKKHTKNIQFILDGFWQNPSSYLHKINQFSKEFLGKPTNPNPLSGKAYIAAHIRRGDYIKESNCALEYSSRFSTAQYIILALQILPEHAKNMPLFVATDDPEWCHKWIHAIRPPGSKQTIVSQSTSTLEDWLMLKNAHVNIIANSTFSFTAAMLNTSNLDEKLRCIMPLWYNTSETVHKKGWSLIPGSIDI